MSSIRIAQTLLLTGVAFLGVAALPMKADAAYVVFDDFSGITTPVNSGNILPGFPIGPLSFSSTGHFGNNSGSITGWNYQTGTVGQVQIANVSGGYFYFKSDLTSGDSASQLANLFYDTNTDAVTIDGLGVDQIRLHFNSIGNIDGILDVHYSFEIDGTPTSGTINLGAGSNQYYFIDLGTNAGTLSELSLTFVGTNPVFNHSYNATLTEIALVPEPSRALLGLAGVGLLMIQRRRK